jgi:HSP20 family molecular chaperone IbpA
VKAERGKLISPKITVNHQLEGNGFFIEIDLAGASKETVELELGTYGFSVKAEGEDIQYYGNFPLGYNIIPEKAKANYDNGVLHISLPVKEKTLKGSKVEIV